MGFEDGRIVLNSESGTYNVGDTILGRIVFDQRKPRVIQGIYVTCIGFCKVHWTETETHTVDNHEVQDLVEHDAYEEYFNKQLYVFGDAIVKNQLEPGHHEYHFDCPIPSNCPSSYEGTHGHIRYQVKAVMVVSEATSKEKLSVIRVQSPVNLNQNPYCKEPIEFEMLKSYSCFCISAGSSAIKVKLPAGGYCPGQAIGMNVSINNTSSVEIEMLKMYISKIVTFTATSVAGSKTESEIVSGYQINSIEAGTSRSETITIDIPEMDVYNLNSCKFIDIDYRFNVETKVGGCYATKKLEYRPVIFGTIPLEDTEDDNTRQDQMPLHFQQFPNLQSANYYPHLPIINQPMSNYPQFSPYPPGVPYSPAPMMPYPNVSPYQPYPAYPVPNPVPAQQPAPTSTNFSVTVNIPDATETKTAS